MAYSMVPNGARQVNEKCGKRSGVGAVSLSREDRSIQSRVDTSTRPYKLHGLIAGGRYGRVRSVLGP